MTKLFKASARPGVGTDPIEKRRHLPRPGLHRAHNRLHLGGGGSNALLDKGHEEYRSQIFETIDPEDWTGRRHTAITDRSLNWWIVRRVLGGSELRLPLTEVADQRPDPLSDL